MTIHNSLRSRAVATAAVVSFLLFAPILARAEEAAEEPAEPAGGEATAGPAEPAGGEAAEDSAEATERARALFAEGVDLADRGEWADAAERFENALALRDAPTIRYNLAAALARLERHAEAADQLDAVLASEETPDDLRSRAETLLAEVEGQTARLEVTAEGFEPGVTFALDGAPLAADRLGAPLRVDAGSHVATAADAAGEEVARETVEVAAGETARVRLAPPASAVDDAITDAADGGEDGESTPLVEDWRLWLGVGVGAAVIVTAIAVGVAVGTSSGVEDPIRGNMDPGVLVWR